MERMLIYDLVMSGTVYLETSVISYLAAWPSGDLVTAAHQKITHEWWSVV